MAEKNFSQAGATEEELQEGGDPRATNMSFSANFKMKLTHFSDPILLETLEILLKRLQSSLP